MSSSQNDYISQFFCASCGRNCVDLCPACSSTYDMLTAAFTKIGTRISALIKPLCFWMFSSARIQARIFFPVQRHLAYSPHNAVFLRFFSLLIIWSILACHLVAVRHPVRGFQLCIICGRGAWPIGIVISHRLSRIRFLQSWPFGGFKWPLFHDFESPFCILRTFSKNGIITFGPIEGDATSLQTHKKNSAFNFAMYERNDDLVCVVALRGYVRDPAIVSDSLGTASRARIQTWGDIVQ